MPAEVVYRSSADPDVSVVIPTFDGDRGGNVPRLVEQLETQQGVSLEVILSVGESPNGHARNVGADAAHGRYLVFIDDDVILGGTDTLDRLIRPLVEDPEVGLTGVSQLLPPDANAFQRRCGCQLPRTVSPIVDELTDSDMVTTMCLAISSELFGQIGKMNDWIIAGVDPELRYRVRQAGCRVVVVPRAWAFHPAPDHWGFLFRYAYKKGSFTAWQYRFARDLMYDCPEGHEGEFEEQTTLVFRVIRKAVGICGELLTGRFWGLAYDLVYTIGYVHGLVRRWEVVARPLGRGDI